MFHMFRLSPFLTILIKYIYYIFLLQLQAEEDHGTPPQTHKQVTVTEAFQCQQKYDKNSPEARKLNLAVAEFICIDKVPIYTVQKCGFQQMLHHFNPKYQLPS